MKSTNFVEDAQKEVSELVRKMDNLVDEYLGASEMPKEQRLVNVGRAINAFHVAWVANLGAELEARHKQIISAGKRSVPAFSNVKKSLDL